MSTSVDAYRVLQVDPAAEPAVIAAAYRALARIYHPDGTMPNPLRMGAINHAYELLRDSESRRRYDVVRAQRTPVPMEVGQQRADGWRPRAEGDHASPVLDFGRYLGWRICDLARHDPDYLRWLSRHSSGLRFRDAIARVLPREPDLVRRANSVA